MAALQTEKSTTQNLVHMDSEGIVHNSKQDKTELENIKDSDNLVDDKDQN